MLQLAIQLMFFVIDKNPDCMCFVSVTSKINSQVQKGFDKVGPACIFEFHFEKRKKYD